MNLKKFISLSLVATMTISLAACTSTETSGDAQKEETAQTGGKTKITVTYREDGAADANPLYKWLQAAYETYDKKDQIELNIAPISASEGDYFAKIALSLQSADTAPNLVAEDTFQLATDVAAGYLTNLDTYLAEYDDWNNGAYFDKLKIGVTAADGSIYGVPYSTDTRGLWYNKEIFKQAGLPEEWEPRDWAEIIEACKTIKEKVPDVVPFWCNSGVATGEGTSMQTYEMLLYGTGERLIDEESGKWVVSSQGILDSLNFIKDIYSNNLGPSLSKVLNGQAGNTAAREYLPQGKLAILLDGNWVQGNYGPEGVSPWEEYSEVLGFAPMPTQYGQDEGSVTLAGGWAWSIPEKSKNKEDTFDFIKHLMDPAVYTQAIINMGNICTRIDVNEDPAYAGRPFMQQATNFLEGADFRPKDEKYSQVSTHIQSMVEAVASGTSPEDAMANYVSDVTRTVGEDSVMIK